MLIATNIYISFFLLLTAGKIARLNLSRVRLCLGALAGGVSACTILLPPMSMLLSTVLKVAVALVLSLIAYGFGSIRRFIRATLMLIVATFAFGGMMLALSLVVSPSKMQMNNGAVYLDVSPVFLVVMTLVCYAAISTASRIASKRSGAQEGDMLTIFLGARSITCRVLLDSGNTLAEPFSSLPVVVVRREVIAKLLAPEEYEKFLSAQPTSIPMRLIPYESIGGQGLLPAFKADRIELERMGSAVDCACAYIAAAPKAGISGQFDAIASTDIII